MNSNRTNRFMQSLREKTKQVGPIAKCIPVYRETPIELKEDREKRFEIQTKIRQCVSKGCREDEIKQELQKEEYKKYANWFDSWIVEVVLKQNLNMKNFIKKQVEEYKEFEEIQKELSQVDAYMKYEKIIDLYLKKCIERRKIEKVKETEKEKQKLKDIEDQER